MSRLRVVVPPVSSATSERCCAGTVSVPLLLPLLFRTDVTPPRQYKAPLPRVLATFVATPYGIFIYGGARPGSNLTSRLPLCDLWHLKKMLPGPSDPQGEVTFIWEDCNRMPKCSVEHAGSPDSGPPLLRTPVGADRVVVGHDAHAWAFMEPSHIVVRRPMSCHMLPMCCPGRARPGRHPCACPLAFMPRHFGHVACDVAARTALLVAMQNIS